MQLRARSRTTLAWSLWLATFGCCAGGLAVTQALTRPLTLAILAEGAAYALAYPLGYATIGLVLSLRHPSQPHRLAVHRRRADLVTKHSPGPLGHPAEQRRPVAAAGRPGRLRRRAAPLGAGHRLWHHPAAAAAA